MQKLNLLELKNSLLHFPVLIEHIINNLNNLSPNSIVLDCTFGAGGYSKNILKYTKANVIAIDRDENVIKFANALKTEYPNRFSFHLNTFSNYNDILDNLKITAVDAIILDLGISNMQLFSNRGFSFKDNASLSMQMGVNSLSTYNFLNFAKESLIADVIYYYGEEHKAKVIAKNIVNYRKTKPLETTTELVAIILNSGVYSKNIHPATKTMQAIRIYINNELQELHIALLKSIDYLQHKGKLLVVSFHSLEDKITKDFIKDCSITINESKKFTSYKLNTTIINKEKVFNAITKKPIVATIEELKINPPSSSAKLRIAEKNI